MKFAILCLPRYKHLKQMIFRQLAALEHTFHIFEELHREFIDGGLAHLEYPRNVVPVLCEKLDYGALARYIDEQEIDQVISFSDRGMLLAAELREQFAMGGNTTQSELWVFDKRRMRERLHECGLSRIRFKNTTLDRLIADSRDQPLPVIVKPASLGASICVELIESREAFRGYIERCRSNRVFDDGNLIIEQYVPGAEFSVEGIIARGEIGFLGVTESHTSGVPYFVGMGHDFFTRHPDASGIYEFTAAVIRCLGLDNCPFHIELKRAEGGYEVLEAHTRFAGAMIMELVERATGVKVFSHYVETLAGARLNRPRGSDGYLYCEHLLCTSEGVVEQIRLDPQVTNDERVISFALDYSPGEVIEADVVPVEYAGYIAFKAKDVEEANRFRSFADEHFEVKLTSVK